MSGVAGAPVVDDDAPSVLTIDEVVDALVALGFGTSGTQKMGPGRFCAHAMRALEVGEQPGEGEGGSYFNSASYTTGNVHLASGYNHPTPVAAYNALVPLARRHGAPQAVAS